MAKTIAKDRYAVCIANDGCNTGMGLLRLTREEIWLR